VIQFNATQSASNVKHTHLYVTLNFSRLLIGVYESKT